MGKGGGKAHTPREAKDNLKSTQMMSVIDAIGEGPIEGPVKGLQSILVNKTPLTDTDGNPVIHGVTAVWRAGEQEQTPPEGFESSGAETGLGVEVTKAKPVTRTITSANIDRLRVTFGVQSLVQTTSKGDRNPSSVRILIQLQRNGRWVTEKDVTINGKTTSQFLASVILDNLPPRPFNIRMVRETADSTTDQLQNKTLWSSYTEIIDVKQCYPNTAIVGLQVDAEQFGGQQMTVNYHISGAITANTGTLNNVTINENCVIRGKLSANQIEGDLVKTVGKAFPRDSRAPERWPSGTITVRVYDDQPFDRQIVIPAVAFSGARHERENNDIYSSCRLIVRKNGAEIYNRTALDNTLVYSGVIDMPAGRGHMTLEFSVSAWWVNGWYPTASISDLLVVVMKKATAGITIS